MWLWRIRKSIRLSSDTDADEAGASNPENKYAEPSNAVSNNIDMDKDGDHTICHTTIDSNLNEDRETTDENSMTKPTIRNGMGRNFTIRSGTLDENERIEGTRKACPSSCRVTVHHHHHHHHFYLHRSEGSEDGEASGAELRREYKNASVDGRSVEDALSSRTNQNPRKETGFRLPLIRIAEPSEREIVDRSKISYSHHQGSDGSNRSIIFGTPSSEVLPPIPRDSIGRFVTLGNQNTQSPQGTPEDKTAQVVPGSEDKEKGIKSQKARRKHLKRGKTKENFLKSIRHVHRTGNFSPMQRFYAKTFSSFNEIMALFKAESEVSGVEYEAWHPSLRDDILDVVHDELSQMPQTIHKTVLKSIVIAMLQDRELALADEVRAFFILIQNPVFAAQSSYTVFAYLLKQIANMPNIHKQLLIQWFRGMEAEKLRRIIQNIIQFINVRQFPPTSRRHIQYNSCSHWWIPTAAKVLGLINASIELSKPSQCFPTSNKSADSTLPPPPILFTDLYNSALDHLDLMNEFFLWQNSSQSNQGQFSYCQYPFLLSIVAKRIILTKDSEQQMIQTARRSIEAKGPFYRYRYRHQPQMDIFFLNIRIRRSHLVSDSLNEIATKQQDLKKKLKVSFIGEPGLDMGGLAKEWLLLLIRHIFEPDYGMFVYHPNSRCYWFSTSAGIINSEPKSEEKEEVIRNRQSSAHSNSSCSSSSEGTPHARSRASSYESHIVSQNKNLREFNLIGVLMGLAVYNSITLDLHFPSICYRKLLSPPIAPWSYIAEPEAEDEQENFDYDTDADSSDDDSIEYNESDHDALVHDHGKLISSFSVSAKSQYSAISTLKHDKVGFVEAPSIEALAEIMPDVARGLLELLAYEGNVEEDMCMNFQVSLEEYGEVRTYDMKEGGGDIPVTNENRHEYVALYLDWILNSAIYHQFRAFYLGFHSVCDSNALLLLRPEEVEMLVCGSPTIDLHELKKVTEYDGYHEDDPIIRDFWEVLESLPLDLQKKFLHFTTGSDRIPVGGMSEMAFKITKLPPIPTRGLSRMRRRNGETRSTRQNDMWDSNDQEEQLPEAHTCFNQLVLPPYRSQETLRQKLIIAISNSEGFGLE